MYAVAWAFYAVLFIATVTLIRPRPFRVQPSGTTQIGIAAFNPGPVGTAGTSPEKAAPTQPPKKAPPNQPTRAKATSRDQAEQVRAGSGAAGTQGTGSGTGPVNLGTGAGLTLLKKVVPTYPRVMEQARIVGTVVLDAIIHRDGSIGDVTVKSSTNGAFVQAAVDAVRQWRYTPIPYEGIVTVTVNFDLSR
jgi:protein TonB